MTKKELKDKIQTFQIFRGKVVTPWMRRAMTRPEFRTKDNESTRSGSFWHNKKELLIPTIRMRGPGLEKMDFGKAAKEALKRKDYIEFDIDPTPNKNKATEFSIEFSNHLGGQYVYKRKDKK